MHKQPENKLARKNIRAENRIRSYINCPIVEIGSEFVFSVKISTCEDHYSTKQH